MTCPEKLTEVEDILDIPAPTTDITEDASTTPQEIIPEKTVEPAKQVRFVITRKKLIAKPIKITLKQRSKSRKGRKSVKRVEADSKETSCKICGETFKNGVALGGHASKAHPGGSLAYKRKIEVREARAEERQFLLKSKEWFTDHFPAADPKAQQSRGYITKIKVLLMNGRIPDINDFKRIENPN